jgi:hypothetical protein
VSYSSPVPKESEEATDRGVQTDVATVGRGEGRGRGVEVLESPTLAPARLAYGEIDCALVAEVGIREGPAPKLQLPVGLGPLDDH